MDSAPGPLGFVQPEGSAEYLVLGLGNILLGDEGVGVRVVERLLERFDFPHGVRVMDGGTLGLELLPYLEDATHLLVLDAVQSSASPGTLLRLTGAEIPAFLDVAKVSVHQEGLQDLLAAATLKGYLPEVLVFWGVQIESLGVGLELSPTVADQVEPLAQKALEELARWGIQPRRKQL